MVWSNPPDQGVTAGTVQHRGVGRIRVQRGAHITPKDAAKMIFGRGCDEQTSLPRGSPTKPNRFRNSLENFNTIFQNFEGILVFHPSMAQLTTLSFALFVL